MKYCTRIHHKDIIIKAKKNKTLEVKYDHDNAIGKYLYNKNRKHIRALPRAEKAVKPPYREFNFGFTQQQLQFLKVQCKA